MGLFGSDSDEVRVRKRYKRVKNAIDDLEYKVRQQKGIWFFRRHKYTVEELLGDSHFKKIESLARKIDDDLTHWYKAKQLTENGWKAMKQEGNEIKERMDLLYLSIRERSGTVWEKIKKVLKSYFKIIMNLILPNWARALGFFAKGLLKPSPDS